LPAEIGLVVRVILEAGAKADKRSIDTTLGLVSSGCIPRQSGVQIDLLDLLCKYGAEPDSAMAAALALAAQHGHTELVGPLLDAGADPNRYNPEGTHAHSTPLHQAVIGGHAAVVRLLLKRGASLDVKDLIYLGTPLGGTPLGGTPLGWAIHAGRADRELLLRGQAIRS
jgi:ankyrin repeat protein